MRIRTCLIDDFPIDVSYCMTVRGFAGPPITCNFVIPSIRVIYPLIPGEIRFMLLNSINEIHLINFYFYLKNVSVCVEFFCCKVSISVKASLIVQIYESSTKIYIIFSINFILFHLCSFFIYIKEADVQFIKQSILPT